MSRDGSGNYSLPLPPVVTGGTIEASWANTTLDDVKAALTDSLSRNGSGGMLAAFKTVDGAVGAPSLAFNNEANSGFYRAGSGDLRAAILGTDLFRLSSSNGVQAYDLGAWKDVLLGDPGTVVNQTLRWNNTSKKWEPSSNFTVDAAGAGVFAGDVSCVNLNATGDVGGVNLNASGNSTIAGDLVFDERADHASTPAAGKGYLWVRNDTPSTLIFTDDAGTDYDLSGFGLGDVIKVGTPVDNQIGVWTGDGTIEGSTALTFNGTVFNVNGSITLTGNVDGRDVSSDGAKLDNIEANADVTDETNVKAALDGATITNATIVGTDKVLFQDGSAADALRQDDAQTLANLADDISPSKAVIADLKINGPIKHDTVDGGTGSETINVESNNRHRITNNGALTLTFSYPTGSDADLGASWTIEGHVVIDNGATPGTITISGFAGAEEEIGAQVTTANVRQVLTYIISRGNTGTMWYTLVWSN